MQSQINIKPWYWMFIIMLMVLFSCKNPMEEHYEKPSYLAGTAWEDLTQRGEYSMFLSGVEKAGYKNLVNGRGLVNVMAPNDEAFTTYLASKNYGTLDAMPQEELVKLIGYHLLFDNYNKSEYAHYNPFGSGNEVPSEMGLYYKHRTNARNPITREIDYVQDSLEVGVFHKDLFLPVFSDYLFKSKEIDPAYNYEYFYPNSTWTDDPLGFNVSEATVTEYEIVTDNGFIYLVDRVLEPLETIHESLKNKGSFSNFLGMYDRFSFYWLDAEATQKYGNGEDLYIHQHSGLPMIASEWPYNGEGFYKDYENLPALSGDAFNVFVPDNATFEGFFQEYWADYYGSLADVHLLPVVYLLYNHVNQGSIVFPEEIAQGRLQTALGTPIIFDPETDVAFSQVCTNGGYYGLNRVLVPDMFNSVTGPLFRNPEYQMFLHMTAVTGLSLTLSSSAVNYTVFLPKDTAMVSTGYYDLPIQYKDPNPLIFGDESIQVLDGNWRDMSSGEMTTYVNSHVATEQLTTVGEITVFKSRNSYSYLYAKTDAIASNRMYNEETGFSSIQFIDGNWINGFCYNVDTAILREDKAFKYELSSADETPHLKAYEEFSKLLTRAGLLSIDAPLDFILDNYMLFVPSNEAILNAPAGTIPEEEQELAEYLKYYFVSVAENNLSDYAFSGAGIQGTYTTFQNKDVSDTIPPSPITLIDNGSSLSLSNVTGSQSASVISELPKVYGDCAVYVIDALIQPED